MARQPRIDYPGAFHHVMNRGAARQNTYRTEADRELFLELWAKAVSRFGIEVVAYCLMGNHYHFFVHSPDGQLSVTMQFIGRAYTQAFNQFHERDGALFRGRFHSVLVDSENYFARVARYIELNPVSAGLCPIDDLWEYPWSSYQYYAGASATPSWLTPQHVWDRFESVAHYQEFVGARVPDRELIRFYDRPLRPTRVLGDDAFVEKLKANHPDIGFELTAGLGGTTPHEIESLIALLSGCSLREVFERSQPMTTERQVALLLAQELTDEPRLALARRYGFATAQGFENAAGRIRASGLTSDARWLRDAILASLAA